MGGSTGGTLQTSGGAGFGHEVYRQWRSSAQEYQHERLLVLSSRQGLVLMKRAAS